MKLVQIVILAGSHCVSPVTHMEGLSEVSKVPCAVIVNRDTETNAVTTEPPGLAATPEVLALLGQVKPVQPKPHMAVAPAPPPKPRSNDVRIVPVSDSATASKPRPAKSSARKRVATKALPDRCGSYKAIWYTAKSGTRRYRCVRQG